MRNCSLPMLAALPALTPFPRARGCPTQSAILSACLHSRILAVGFFQRWPRCLHPLPTRTWLSPAVLSDYSIKCRFLHARGYPLPALGVLSAPAPFPRARLAFFVSCRHSVKLTTFRMQAVALIPMLGTLPAPTSCMRVVILFPHWAYCPRLLHFRAQAVALIPVLGTLPAPTSRMRVAAPFTRWARCLHTRSIPAWMQ